MFKKLLLAAALLLSGPAAAQWQVPDNNIPAGRGAGTGFKAVAPSANSVLWSQSGGLPVFSSTPQIGAFLGLGGGVSTGDVAVFIGSGRTGSGVAVLNLHSTNSGVPTAQLAKAAGTNSALSLSNVGTSPISLFVNAIEQGQVTTSGLLSRTDGYYNFAAAGSAGYGFRDNAGIVEFKHSGGVWSPIQVTTNLYAATYGMICDGIGGTDNTTALSNALDAAIAINAKLILPPGFCRVNSAISKTLTGSQVLVLAGAGQENTVLHFPNATHGLAFAYVTSGWWPRGASFDGNMVQLQDFTITTTQVGAFNALTIACNGLHGRPQPASTAIRNVTIRGNLNTQGWGVGSLMDACYGTLIDNVTFFGAQIPGNVGRAFEYSNSGGAGTGGTQHSLRDVVANFAEKVISIVGDPDIGDGVEGIHVNSLHCVNVTYCVHWAEPATGVEPLLEIVNAHMNIYGGGAGVIVTSVAQVQLTNINVYMLAGPATAFFFDGVRQATLTNNTVYSSNNTSIGLDWRNTTGLSWNDAPSTVDNNSWAGSALGIGIRLGANVQYVNVGPSNVFSLGVVSKIEDSGTNNIIVENQWTAHLHYANISLKNTRTINWLNAAGNASLSALYVDASDNLIIDPNNDFVSVFVGNHFVPGTNNIYTLGAGALRWSTVYGINADFSGTTTLATSLTGLLTSASGVVSAVASSSTVGQVLRVTGANTYAWGALDLADSDARTGQLPAANVVTGTSGAAIPLLNGNNTYSGTASFTGSSFAVSSAAITLGDASGDLITFTGSVDKTIIYTRNGGSQAAPSSYTGDKAQWYFNQNDNTGGLGFTRYLDIVATGDTGSSNGIIRFFVNNAATAAAEGMRLSMTSVAGVASLLVGSSGNSLSEAFHVRAAADQNFSIRTGLGTLTFWAINDAQDTFVNMAFAAGNINYDVTGITINAGTGFNGTKTVRDAAGVGTCTLVFTHGILTGGTC